LVYILLASVYTFARNTPLEQKVNVKCLSQRYFAEAPDAHGLQSQYSLKYP